jgi:hypothetical protein
VAVLFPEIGLLMPQDGPSAPSGYQAPFRSTGFVPRLDRAVMGAPMLP